jgi:hypothetical protein
VTRNAIAARISAARNGISQRGGDVAAAFGSVDGRGLDLNTITLAQLRQPGDQSIERRLVKSHVQAAIAAGLAADQTLCQPGFTRRSIYQYHQRLAQRRRCTDLQSGQLWRHGAKPLQIVALALDPLLDRSHAPLQRQHRRDDDQQQRGDAAEQQHAALARLQPLQVLN